MDKSSIAALPIIEFPGSSQDEIIYGRLIEASHEGLDDKLVATVLLLNYYATEEPGPISLVQRHLKLGFSRAKNLIAEIERRGLLFKPETDLLGEANVWRLVACQITEGQFQPWQAIGVLTGYYARTNAVPSSASRDRIDGLFRGSRR